MDNQIHTRKASLLKSCMPFFCFQTGMEVSSFFGAEPPSRQAANTECSSHQLSARYLDKKEEATWLKQQTSLLKASLDTGSGMKNI